MTPPAAWHRRDREGTGQGAVSQQSIPRCAAGERRRRAGREFRLRNPPQKVGRLFRRKLQVGLPDFYHLPARSQASKRPRGILARDDNQVHLGRLMLQKESQLLVNGNALIT